MEINALIEKKIEAHVTSLEIGRDALYYNVVVDGKFKFPTGLVSTGHIARKGDLLLTEPRSEGQPVQISAVTDRMGAGEEMPNEWPTLKLYPVVSGAIDAFSKSRGSAVLSWAKRAGATKTPIMCVLVYLADGGLSDETKIAVMQLSRMPSTGDNILFGYNGEVGVFNDITIGETPGKLTYGEGELTTETVYIDGFGSTGWKPFSRESVNMNDLILAEALTLDIAQEVPQNADTDDVSVDDTVAGSDHVDESYLRDSVVESVEDGEEHHSDGDDADVVETVATFDITVGCDGGGHPEVLKSVWGEADLAKFAAENKETEVSEVKGFRLDPAVTIDPAYLEELLRSRTAMNVGSVPHIFAGEDMTITADAAERRKAFEVAKATIGFMAALDEMGKHIGGQQMLELTRQHLKVKPVER